MQSSFIRGLAAIVAAFTLTGVSVKAQSSFSVVDIGSSGYGLASVTGINNAGQVSGTDPDSAGRNRAILWTPDGTDGIPTNPQMKQLFTPKVPGWNDPGTRGLGLKDQGAVVGYTAQGYWFACLWTSPALPQVTGASRAAPGPAVMPTTAWAQSQCRVATGCGYLEGGQDEADTERSPSS